METLVAGGCMIIVLKVDPPPIAPANQGNGAAGSHLINRAWRSRRRNKCCLIGGHGNDIGPLLTAVVITCCASAIVKRRGLKQAGMKSG